SDLTNSPFMDLMTQYGIGRGSFRQHDNVGLAQPVNDDGSLGGMEITNQSIMDMIDAQMTDPDGAVAMPDSNTMYIVFTAPGVAVDYAAENGFQGYHGAWFGSQGQYINEAVVTYGADQPDPNAFDGLTGTASHELAEGVTDPDGGG